MDDLTKFIYKKTERLKRWNRHVKVNWAKWFNRLGSNPLLINTRKNLRKQTFEIFKSIQILRGRISERRPIGDVTNSHLFKVFPKIWQIINCSRVSICVIFYWWPSKITNIITLQHLIKRIRGTSNGQWAANQRQTFCYCSDTQCEFRSSAPLLLDIPGRS